MPADKEEPKSFPIDHDAEVMGATTTTGGPRNGSDPILVAINQHRAADAAVAAMNARNARSDLEIEIAMQAEDRAFWSLVEVRPTTATGVWALCDHLAEYAMDDDLVSERSDYNRERGWCFMTRLLENIRDALEKIENYNKIVTPRRAVSSGSGRLR